MEDAALKSQRLARASRSAATIFLIVFVIAASAVGYSLLQLSKIENLIRDRRGEIGQLENSVRDLNETVKTLRSSPDSTQARAMAQALPATRRGAPLFDLAIWIDRSSFVQPVKQVTYQSKHPFLKEPKTEREPKNGFAVSFRGTESPKRVAIDVVLEDGRTQAIDFDMCSAARKSVPSIPCLRE